LRKVCRGEVLLGGRVGEESGSIIFQTELAVSLFEVNFSAPSPASSEAPEVVIPCWLWWSIVD
jgi:hypothetical protein